MAFPIHISPFSVTNGGRCALRCAKTLALCVSLVGSALTMAFLVDSPGYHLLGWLALLTMFLAIRVCRPVHAGLGSALWGLTLFASLAKIRVALPRPSYSAGSAEPGTRLISQTLLCVWPLTAHPANPRAPPP